MHCCEPQCLCCWPEQIEIGECVASRQQITQTSSALLWTSVPVLLLFTDPEQQVYRLPVSNRLRRPPVLCGCTSVPVLLSFADPEQQVHGLPVHNGPQRPPVHCVYLSVCAAVLCRSKTTSAWPPSAQRTTRAQTTLPPSLQATSTSSVARVSCFSSSSSPCPLQPSWCG